MYLTELKIPTIVKKPHKFFRDKVIMIRREICTVRDHYPSTHAICDGHGLIATSPPCLESFGLKPVPWCYRQVVLVICNAAQ